MKISLSKTYIKRIYNAAPGAEIPTKDNYYETDIIMDTKGVYNFDLDNSIIFGIEREDDQIGYNKDLTGKKVEIFFYTSSTYFDYQKRFTKIFLLHLVPDLMIIQLQVTKSPWATLAYLFDDKSTKIKSSYGTGFRFPSL